MRDILRLQGEGKERNVLARGAVAAGTGFFFEKMAMLSEREDEEGVGGLKKEKKRVRWGWDDGLCVLERGAGGLTGVWVGCWCCWLSEIGESKVGEGRRCVQTRVGERELGRKKASS